MKRDVFDRLLAIAATQFGLFAQRQAADLGITKHMLDTLVRKGWIRSERRGVYSIAGSPPSQWRLIYSAALAAGPLAVISHTSAAAIQGVYGVVAEGIELTVPREHPQRLQDVRIHRSRSVLPIDVDSRSSMAITTPVRTVIDLAARFHDPLLGKIVDEGVISRIWTVEAIMGRLDQLPASTRGSSDLRQVLAIRLGEGRPDSQLEQRVLRVVKRFFPGYVPHYRVELGGEVIVMDIAWPKLKIGAEVDGMAVRVASRSKFERSCRRENILVAHGWRVVHLTAKMDEAAIVAQLAPLFN